MEIKRIEGEGTGVAVGVAVGEVIGTNDYTHRIGTVWRYPSIVLPRNVCIGKQAYSRFCTKDISSVATVRSHPRSGPRHLFDPLINVGRSWLCTCMGGTRGWVERPRRIRSHGHARGTQKCGPCQTIVGGHDDHFVIRCDLGFWLAKGFSLTN